jgi:protein required for attachment to host cells
MMLLPTGATVAVADGEKLALFRNTGDETHPKLTALPSPDIATDNKGTGGRHHSSSANPGESQQSEDDFAGGIADMLNSRVLNGTIKQLVVIAAPRTLGELRKRYHKSLSAILLTEIAKDLTGHAIPDIEASIAAA